MQWKLSVLTAFVSHYTSRGGKDYISGPVSEVKLLRWIRKMLACCDQRANSLHIDSGILLLKALPCRSEWVNPQSCLTEKQSTKIICAEQPMLQISSK